MISGMEQTSSAFAGVGKPRKRTFCLSSVLNLASRIAAQTGINIDSQHNLPSGISTAVIIPGATPKETMSARESNSLPMVDFALSILAAKPSRKSAAMAPNMNHEATSAPSSERPERV